MAGHIKLDRKILTWEWYQDVNTCRLFIHLLLTANHRDGRWQGYEIKRGQVITGLSKLSQSTTLTIRELRTCFSKLKMTGEITIKTTSKFRVVTICKYDTYQSSKNENDKQIDKQEVDVEANERQASDKQATTNNNVNNNKEETIIAQKHLEDMVVLEMMKIWKQFFPSYIEDKEKDYTACLQIAYKIAAAKRWKQQEVLNGKMPDTLKSWEKIVSFIKSESFYRKLTLETICSKWQGLQQTMEAARQSADEKSETQEGKPKLIFK